MVLIVGVAHVVVIAGLACLGRWHVPTSPQHRVTMVMPLPLVAERRRDVPKPAIMPAAEVPRQKPMTPLVQPPTLMPRLASPPAETAEAPPSSSESGGRTDRIAEITQDYRYSLITRLEAARRYPRRALLEGYEGAGAILFRIDRDGRLIDLSVAASTGRRELDHGALALVRRAAPFPAIPQELPDELAITMPVRFLILGQPVQMVAR